MKKFKKIDCWISSGLMPFFTIYTLTASKGFEALIMSYCIVGAWQLISMLVHAVTHYFTRRWSIRYIYHWISFISVITIPIGSIWILTVAAPFMALFYTWLCYEETYVKLQRPLAMLK